MKNKGFTLIELLIVVAIIAILAAIAVPNFLEAQVRAKVSRARSDMRSIAVAIESYAVDNNKPIIAQNQVQFTSAASAVPFGSRKAWCVMYASGVVRCAMFPAGSLPR